MFWEKKQPQLSNFPQVLTDDPSVLTFSIWLPWWVAHLCHRAVTAAVGFAALLPVR